MGLFDNLMKMADRSLDAVENGAVEKALAGGLDKLEAGLDKAIDTAEKAAAVPEKVLEKAEAKHEQATQVAQNIRQHTVRTINIIQK
jgi:F0F1-type ATP synthase membrane subunit b/b'